MTKRSIEHTFRLMSLLLAAVIVGVLVYLTFLSVQLASSSDEERDSGKIVSYVSILQLRVIDVETAQRGYVLTGQESFLDPFERAVERIAGIEPPLREFVADDPAQRRRVSEILTGVDEYVDAFARPNVALARTDRSAAGAKVASRSGKDRIDKLRAQFDDVLEIERARRDERARESAQLARRAQIVSAAAIIAILAALGLFVAFVSRSLVRPMTELRDVVVEFARGNLRARAPRSYRGEAEDLSRSVASLAQELEQAQAILERRAAEIQEHARALERSNADLEQFAYAAAHDLQEPLRMVASYTSLIERRYKGKLDDDADEFIRYAVDGAKRMQRLINDLLTYSRVNTANSNLIDVPIDSAVDEALENLQARIDDRRATVDVDVDADVAAFGQRGQMVMLFQNLIGNALRFAGDAHPTVAVHAHASDGRIVAWVDDDGPGIEPEYRERVFRIFQRLGARDEHAGTGIGLALCRRIVERHGGEIHVESSPLGGARFRFDLPATTVEHRAHSADARMEAST